MPRLACALFALMMAAGCGGKGAGPAAPATPPPVASSDPVVARVTAYAQATCACETAACVEAVHADVEAWANEHGDEMGAALADTLRAAQLDAIVDRARSCENRLVGESGDGDGGMVSPEQAIARMGALADEMCACADAACAEQVTKAHESMKERTIARSSNTQMDQMVTIAERMAECQSKLVGSGDGASAPR